MIRCACVTTGSNTIYFSLLQKVFIVVVLLSLFCTMMFGLVWTVININQIPLYGDTTEYLELAKTLHVDQYRGILYPFFIHVMELTSSHTSFRIPSVLYFFQLGISFLASYFFASTILKTTSWLTRIILSLTIATLSTFEPLNNHFALSILTDSICSSLTITFIASLMRATDNINKTSHHRVAYLTLSMFLYVMMAITRVDREYLGLLIIVGAAILFIRNGISGSRLLAAATYIALTVVTISSIYVINNNTRYYNELRPPLDIANLLFNRIAFPNMEKTYPFFSHNIKKQLSLEEAIEFDRHNNNVYPFIVKQLKKDNGKELLNEITKTTLQHHFYTVIRKTSFDFLKYCLPNISFPMENYNLLPVSAGTSWTVSRMNMFTTDIANMYILVGTLSSFLLLVFFLSQATKKISSASMNISFHPKLFLLLLLVLGNSSLFAFESGMDAHIRYALPSYMVIYLSLVLNFFTTIINQHSIDKGTHSESNH
jgi:hypothetical protein